MLGNCPNNMLLITRRYHRVKHSLMESLTTKGFTCYEEVYAVDDEGTARYADIIGFKRNLFKWILLPRGLITSIEAAVIPRNDDIHIVCLLPDRFRTSSILNGSCLSTAIENGRSPKPVWQQTYNMYVIITRNDGSFNRRNLFIYSLFGTYKQV
ncbi:hypothetical protein O3M35_009506 [Rhynocoris fuscipes]|uniref:Uncharacterized protein n=1 Tax=Rhynocoris fuscipes TaxID=488301 RepID=A0AAW1D5V7_9HEMI